MFAEYPLNIPIRYFQYIYEKSLYEILGIFWYYEMRPVSNQPALFFVTAKTHKFKSLEEINVDQLKLRPISDQTGTYICNHGLLYLHGRLYYIFALKIVGWKLKGIAMVPKLQSE